MLKSLTFISALALVAACDSNNLRGIATLGPDFVGAFNQSPNDEPLDPSGLQLAQTPRAEPFNP
jgi:hypothetical protein